jgi:hypothetical protein
MAPVARIWILLGMNVVRRTRLLDISQGIGGIDAERAPGRT